MTDNLSRESTGSRIDRAIQKPPFERVDPSELGTVARVLAEAFFDDPVLIWAMPKAATRLADATAFFTFYLRRMRPHRWEVFATLDRSAVAIMSSVCQASPEHREGSRDMPSLVRTTSSAGDYFRWIETFHPPFDHRYLEFIGISPTHRSKGQGSVLLNGLLEMSAREGLPVWSWSSNPRNLSFYRRLGFDVGTDLRRDTETPAVTPLLRPPVPLTTSSTATN